MGRGGNVSPDRMGRGGNASPYRKGRGGIVSPRRTKVSGKDVDNVLDMSDIEDDNASPHRKGRGGNALFNYTGRGGNASPNHMGRGGNVSLRSTGRGGNASPRSTRCGGNDDSGMGLFDYERNSSEGRSDSQLHHSKSVPKDNQRHHSREHSVSKVDRRYREKSGESTAASPSTKHPHTPALNELSHLTGSEDTGKGKRENQQWCTIGISSVKSADGKNACLLCRKTFAVESSLSSFKRHLRSIHSIVTEEDLVVALEKKEKQGGSGAIWDCTVATKPIDSWFLQYESNSVEWRRCITAAAQFVSTACLPFSVVEGSPFLRLMKAADRRWPKISRRTITRRVESLAEEARNNIAKSLKEWTRGTDYAFTTDMWSSIGGDHFITMTVHHIDEKWVLRTRILGTMSFNEKHTFTNIARKLRRYRRRFGLVPQEVLAELPPLDDSRESGDGALEKEEISAWNKEELLERPTITTDCGANIAKAVEEGLGCDWCKCICHILHLAVKHGLGLDRGHSNELTECIAPLAALARHLHKSSLHWRDFQEIQICEYKLPKLKGLRGDEWANEEEGGESVVEDDEEWWEEDGNNVSLKRKVLRLVQPVETRWNSWYFAIKRAVALKRALIKFMEKGYIQRGEVVEGGVAQNPTSLLIKSEDWPVYEDLLNIMEGIRELCIIMESETKITISRVLPYLLRLLYDKLELGPMCMGKKKTFVQGFKTKLLNLVDDPELVYLWAVHTALDGTMKSQVRKCATMIWDHSEDWPKTTTHWEYCPDGSTKTTATQFVDVVWTQIVYQIKYHLKKEHGGDGIDDQGVQRLEQASTEEAFPKNNFDWDLQDDEPDVDVKAYNEESLTVEAKHIVDSYRGYVPQSRDKVGDAGEWWRLHKGRFPRVESLARRRLCTQASSSTSERAFSKSGRIFSKRRMALTPTHVDQLSLLAWNG